jgi:CRP/FNR family transcriptional regulator
MMFVAEMSQAMKQIGAAVPIDRTLPSAAKRRADPPERASASFADLVADTGAPFAIAAGVADVQFPLRRLKAGESLFRAGDRFDSIYIVRAGFLKAMYVQSNGVEQIMAFPGRGDAVGLDGVASGRYVTDVIALDTSVVAVLSRDRLESLGLAYPAIDRFLHFLFGRDMSRKQEMIGLLGKLTADARVAAFLLDLSRAFARFGQSPTAFVLRMSRQDIGSYLGIKLETVSRTLSALAAAGLIEVSHRSITLTDIDGLRALLPPRSSASGRATPAQAAARRRAALMPQRFTTDAAYV